MRIYILLTIENRADLRENTSLRWLEAGDQRSPLSPHQRLGPIHPKYYGVGARDDAQHKDAADGQGAVSRR